MGWSKHTITQPFNITVKHEDFFNRLAELMEEDMSGNYESMDIECVEVDGEDAMYHGSYDDTVKTWYCRATLESPEESEIEKTYVEDILDLKQIIIDHAEELAKLLKVEVAEDDTDIDWHEDYDDRW